MQVEDQFQEAMHSLVTRVNDDAKNITTLQKLDGEVIGLRTKGGATYYAVIEEQKMRQEKDATPTIWVEGEEKVILDIITGKLDPLVAMATRKLKVNTTPVKGPLLRQLFYKK